MSNQEAVLGTAPYQLDGILGEAERIGTDKKNTTEEIQFDMRQQENRIPTVLHIIIPHGEADRIGTDKKNTTEEIQFDMHQQENRIPTVLHIIIPHRTGALPLLPASNSSRIRSIYDMTAITTEMHMELARSLGRTISSSK
ncbi:hypothetical protein QE152_g31038 [Popillia japonica]|uniref:Uncharacterized protein n=1 Tax=Popillia japonica TaxID=7064 RepID=A0AAW1JD18_POPJA